MTSVRDLPTRPAGRRRRSTPVVLLVGASAQLLERCRRLVCEGVELVECDLPTLAGTAAWVMPQAIILTEAVRSSEPEAFTEVARRVGAELVVLPSEDVSDPELTARVTTALDLAQRSRLGSG
jgi:hypothetical protein